MQTGARNRKILARDQQLAAAPAVLAIIPDGVATTHGPREAAGANRFCPIAKPKAPGLWPEKTKTRLLAQNRDWTPPILTGENRLSTSRFTGLGRPERGRLQLFSSGICQDAQNSPIGFEHLRMIQPERNIAFAALPPMRKLALFASSPNGKVRGALAAG